MANKSKGNKKNIIIGACIALVILVIIILAIIFGINSNGGINNAYFKSDDTKYVLTMDGDEIYFENNEIVPLKVHQVYTYEDDQITSYKIYYQYNNKDDAQSAFNNLKEGNKDDFKSIELKGQYIVLTANEDEYKELTPSDIKEQIKFMELLREMRNKTETDEEAVEETTEETAE